MRKRSVEARVCATEKKSSKINERIFLFASKAMKTFASCMKVESGKNCWWLWCFSSRGKRTARASEKKKRILLWFVSCGITASCCMSSSCFFFRAACFNKRIIWWNLPSMKHYLKRSSMESWGAHPLATLSQLQLSVWWLQLHTLINN